MRKANIKRTTKETDISVEMNLDGSGKSKINTQIAFFDHMLTSFSKHSKIDLEVSAKGDIDVDFHHTIEDTGIVIGECFNKCLGNKIGIKRFASCYVAMDEALSRTVIDISGRQYLDYNADFKMNDDGSNVNPYLFEEFFRSFVNNACVTLHIDVLKGKNTHHIIESIFKSFALSVKESVKITGSEMPSTKGKL